VGRKAGIAEAQLHDLAYFEGSSAFTGKERLVLRLAVALTRTPVSVSDNLFAELRREFSEPQLVELATAIAWGNYRARFNCTFGIAAEGFSEGVFCLLPEHP
jgi:alkylhydroperoxidase family enzyme